VVAGSCHGTLPSINVVRNAGGSQEVKAPLVLVRVMEMMAWVEMSKTNFPRHMWYVEFKY